MDLIVTDYDMPEWNGLKLIQAVRRLNAEIPILMITGFTESSALLEVSNCCVDILQKPVSFSLLAKAIQANSSALFPLSTASDMHQSRPRSGASASLVSCPKKSELSAREKAPWGVAPLADTVWLAVHNQNL